MVKNPNFALVVQVGDIADIAGYQNVEVEIEPHGIMIRPMGYGDKLSMDGMGSPLFIEFRNGIPFVVVWDDINNEDPSHVISLRNAAESNRHGE